MQKEDILQVLARYSGSCIRTFHRGATMKGLSSGSASWGCVLVIPADAGRQGEEITLSPSDFYAVKVHIVSTERWGNDIMGGETWVLTP
ncbi:hypothetical protein [Erwinia billingiae]|uniref:hypothetical protein n=1 Tax=Erwinia billingiae TaxID=182337 RepID=UPI0022481331|nr:hypothetical protein [Erwinia billingiae]MCX0498992.1 hypothetical protein [Erwinia billingiae]